MEVVPVPATSPPPVKVDPITVPGVIFVEVEPDTIMPPLVVVPITVPASELDPEMINPPDGVVPANAPLKGPVLVPAII